MKSKKQKSDIENEYLKTRIEFLEQQLASLIQEKGKQGEVGFI